MKLAEALILRADKQKRIAQLKERLFRSAKVQEGMKPAEKPAQLMAELEAVSKELVALMQKINRTNSSTQFDKSRTLADVLAERDILAKQQAVYRELATNATTMQERFTRHEVVFISTVKVADIQKRADDLARKHRELNTKIQELNWTFDLLE